MRSLLIGCVAFICVSYMSHEISGFQSFVQVNRRNTFKYGALAEPSFLKYSAQSVGSPQQLLRLRSTADGREISAKIPWWRRIGRFFRRAKSQVETSSAETTSKDTLDAGLLMQALEERVPKDNSVFVLGATGRTGQHVVHELLRMNRPVVVSGRNTTKLYELFYQQAIKNDNLYIFPEAVDMRQWKLQPSSSADTPTRRNLFHNVQQLVIATAPSFNEMQQQMMKNANSSVPVNLSQETDAGAVKTAIEAFKEWKLRQPESPHLSSSSYIPAKRRIISYQNDLSQTDPNSVWRRLDDVIMGGSSRSGWRHGKPEETEDIKFVRWSGALITQGGGFCGTVMTNLALPVLSRQDGIHLRIRGDGHRYKFRVKTDVGDTATNEYQYQAMFDTIPDIWQDVFLPWDSFVAVRRNDVQYRAPTLTDLFAKGAKIVSLGFVYSKFTFNERTNVFGEAGSFQLDLQEMNLYHAARPDVVLVSSAGSERINKLMNKEEIKRDIPIVQLNPSGILNWKYIGEELVRQSGLSYAIIRSTGLVEAPNSSVLSAMDNATIAANPLKYVTDKMLLERRRIEVHQGDSVSGRMLRSELAQVIVSALHTPDVVNTTFEVRRDESPSGCLVTMNDNSPNANIVNNWGLLDGDINQSAISLNRPFRSLVPDADRATCAVTLPGKGVRGIQPKRFLPPLPYPGPPL